MNDEKLINKAYNHVQFDDIDEFKKLVPRQVDPNASSFSAQNHLHTFLQCAAAFGAERCTEYLLNLEDEYNNQNESNENSNQNDNNSELPPEQLEENNENDNNKPQNLNLHVDSNY